MARRRCGAGGARIRPLARADAVSQGTHLPEPDIERHRLQAPDGGRLSGPVRSERRAARVRTAEQRDRLGADLAACRPKRARTGHRWADGIAAQTVRRERDRARVADVASVIQSSRHRRATGRRGDVARSGPKDQAGDRRQRLDPSAGRTDRRRPADRRGCVRVSQDAHRDGTGEEPGGRHVRCPGKARPSRERLRRDRGVDVGQPEDQGGRDRQDHRRRRSVQRHLPRRKRHSHIPRRKHLRDLVRERSRSTPCSRRPGRAGVPGSPASAASSCSAS